MQNWVIKISCIERSFRVTQSYLAYRVSFVMPSKYTMDTLPVPKNTDLELKEVPGHSVAALTFFGADT